MSKDKNKENRVKQLVRDFEKETRTLHYPTNYKYVKWLENKVFDLIDLIEEEIVNGK